MNILDLNKLNDEQIKQHKADMDVDFHKNIVRPGHPDYVYDKRKDFKAMRTQAQEAKNDAEGEDSWDD